MLTHLRIEGFKPWRDTGPIRLAPITAFFGANSSGKTSLLQFILMLKQTAASADRTQVFELGGERSLVELGTYDDILFREGRYRRRRLDPEESLDQLRWSISWTLPGPFRIADPEGSRRPLFEGADVRHDAEVRRLADGNLRVERMVYRFAGAGFGMQQKGTGKKPQYDLVIEDSGSFQPKRTRGRAWDLPPPLKCYGFPDQARGYFQNTAFLSDLELMFEEMLASVHYLGPLREYPARQYPWAGSEPADMGRRGEAAIAALLSARRRGPEVSMGRGVRRRTLEEHVAYWLKQLGLIEYFHVEEIAPGSNLYRVKVRKSVATAEVLLTDVGFGVSQVLPVLVLAFYAPEGSIVILEQPELHLHPSVQAGIADVLIDAAERRDLQLIVESHSEHFLLRLQRRVAEGRLEASEAALYFCDRAPDGASKLTELDLDLLGNIRNWPRDFFGDSFGEREAAVRAALKRRKETAA